MENKDLEILSNLVHKCFKCKELRAVTPNSMPYWCISKEPEIMAVGMNPGLEWIEDEFNQKILPQNEFFSNYLRDFPNSKFGIFLRNFFGEDTLFNKVFFTNLVKCRKPRNLILEDEYFFNCLEFLKIQIKIVNPKKIIFFTKKAKIVKKDLNLSIPYLILNHPSYYQYNLDSIYFLQDLEEYEYFMEKSKKLFDIEYKPPKILPDGTFF